jgi:hypothetical protein
MGSNLTKEDALRLIQRLQDKYQMNDYSMSKHRNEETPWLMAVEKYDEFVKLYFRNFCAGLYQGAGPEIVEFLSRPLSDMPLYVNEGGMHEVTAIWRMSIAK